MTNEILVLKAKRSDSKNQLKELTLKADNFIINIRESLNVYEEDFTELPIDRVLQAAKDLHSTWKEAKKLKDLITRMSKDLGKDFDDE